MYIYVYIVYYLHTIFYIHTTDPKNNEQIHHPKKQILKTFKVVGIAPIDRDHQAPLDAEACQDLLEMELLLGFLMVFF